MEFESAPNPTARKRPSRWWYALSALVLLASASLFVVVLISQKQAIRERIDAMPRLVGPTDASTGVVIALDEPGKYSVYYENLGLLNGQAFDTPRYQVWTDPFTPSMTLAITNDGTGEAVAVRLPEVGGDQKKTEISEDLVYPYSYSDRQGSGVWVFEIDEPGAYRFDLAYLAEVGLDPGTVAIPPELTSAQKKEMTREEGAAYDVARREAFKRAAMAELDTVDVLFAVGQDPTQGSYFNVIGLKGAAAVLAFGFTFAALTSLVVLMLRGGHVTPRGELNQARRFFQP